MTTGPGGAGDAGGTRFEAGDGNGKARFRRTLVRVLALQAVALALLWFLQAAYHG